jgi:hypothetical protein
MSELLSLFQTHLPVLPVLSQCSPPLSAADGDKAAAFNHGAIAATPAAARPFFGGTGLYWPGG